MPIIENHSEHPFHFPKRTKPTGDGKGPMDVTATAFEEALLFPRAGDPDDDGNPVPSRTLVSQEDLEAMQKDRVARGWFHRRGLGMAPEDGGELDPKNEDALGGPKRGAGKAKT